MPLVPAHQGLIAPLWRRWPERFNVVALCIGAAMPDVVDGAGGMLFRGHLGQWYGHTLWGMHLLCVPFGLLLMAVALLLAEVLRYPKNPKPLVFVGEWVYRGHRLPDGVGRLRGALFVGYSMWVGCLSHVLFDLIAHGGFRLLSPWYGGPNPIPAWWRATWFTISPPGYDQYSVGPHFVMWLLLSGVGLWLLAPELWRSLRATAQQVDANGGAGENASTEGGENIEEPERNKRKESSTA